MDAGAAMRSLGRARWLEVDTLSRGQILEHLCCSSWTARTSQNSGYGNAVGQAPAEHMLGEGRPLLRDGQGHGKAFGRCGRRSPDEPWDRKSGTVREVKVADYPGRRRGVPPLILLRMSAMMTCRCSIRLSLVQPRWVALKLGHRAATLDSNPVARRKPAHALASPISTKRPAAD